MVEKRGVTNSYETPVRCRQKYLPNLSWPLFMSMWEEFTRGASTFLY